MWTDEKLDERFNEIDRRFDAIDWRLDRIDADVRYMRSTMLGLWGVNMLGVVVILVAIVITNS